MNRSFPIAATIVFTYLALLGCSDELNYRKSLLRQFSEDSAKSLGRNEDATRFVSGHATSTSSTLADSQTKQPLHITIYNILDAILPAKADKIDTQAGYLEYASLNTGKAKRLIGGPLGKYLGQLCKHPSPSEPKVIIREIRNESDTQRKISIVVYCDDELEFFITPSDAGATVQWKHHANDPLAATILELTTSGDKRPSGGKQPLVYVKEENGNQLIAATQDEKLFTQKQLLGDSDKSAIMTISVHANNGKEDGNPVFTMQSEDIFKELDTYKKKKDKVKIVETDEPDNSTMLSQGRPNNSPTRYVVKSEGTHQDDDTEAKRQLAQLRKRASDVLVAKGAAKNLEKELKRINPFFTTDRTTAALIEKLKRYDNLSPETLIDLANQMESLAQTLNATKRRIRNINRWQEKMAFATVLNDQAQILRDQYNAAPII